MRTAHAPAQRLQTHGFDAAILLATGIRYSYNCSDVPELKIQSSIPLQASDILVIPEGWNEYIQSFAASPLRAMDFCQNHYYIFEGLRRTPSFSELGVEKVFCGSDFMAAALKNLMGSRYSRHSLPN